jgi:hypothetical protein
MSRRSNQVSVRYLAQSEHTLSAALLPARIDSERSSAPTRAACSDYGARGRYGEVSYVNHALSTRA